MFDYFDIFSSKKKKPNPEEVHLMGNKLPNSVKLAGSRVDTDTKTSDKDSSDISPLEAQGFTMNKSNEDEWADLELLYETSEDDIRDYQRLEDSKIVDAHIEDDWFGSDLHEEIKESHTPFERYTAPDQASNDFDDKVFGKLSDMDIKGDVENNIEMRRSGNVDRLKKYDESNKQPPAQNGSDGSCISFDRAAAMGMKIFDGKKTCFDTINNYNLLANIKASLEGSKKADTFDFKKIPYIGGTLKKAMNGIDILKNGYDMLTGLKDSYGDYTHGNKSSMSENILKSGFSLMGMMKDVGLSFLPFGKLKNGCGIAQNAVGLARDLYNKRQVDKVISEYLIFKEINTGKEIGEREKRILMQSQDTIKFKLDRDRNQRISRIALNATKFVPAGDLAKGMFDVVVKGGAAINSSTTKEKENKKIAQADIFGSLKKYEELKKNLRIVYKDKNITINKSDMIGFMLRQTGAKSIDEIANQARVEQAQMLHKNATNLESVKELLGASMGISVDDAEGLSLKEIEQLLEAKPDSLKKPKT